MTEHKAQPTPYLLQFFAYAHLPPHLQAVSKPFGETAQALAALAPDVLGSPDTDIARSPAAELFYDLSLLMDSCLLPSNTEATWSLTKIEGAKRAALAGADLDGVLRLLVEAKDCAVRALVSKP